MTIPAEDELYLRVCYPDVDIDNYVEDKEPSGGVVVNGRFYWVKGGWNFEMIGSSTYFKILFRPPDMKLPIFPNDRHKTYYILLRGSKAKFPRWYINHVHNVDSEQGVGYDKHGLKLPNDDSRIPFYVLKKIVLVCKKLTISKLSSVIRILRPTRKS